MFRSQVDSQSKVWNAVQSALLLERAPIVLDRGKIVVQRQFDAATARRPGTAAARSSTIGVGIGPEHVFELAFEHDLCRHDFPGARENWRRPLSTN